MSQIEKISSELHATMELIRVLHRSIMASNSLICEECGKIWPCKSSRLAIGALNLGTEHMARSNAHVQGMRSSLQSVLQKIDERFSSYKIDVAEKVIDRTHTLAITEGLEVYGFTNCRGESEYQVEKTVDSENSIPLWTLTLGLPMGIRIFGPPSQTKLSDFFREVLLLGFSKPEGDDLVEWWSVESMNSSSYITTPLPENPVAACKIINELCSATFDFCGDKWRNCNDLL